MKKWFKNTKPLVRALSFEVTRKCNLECSHCGMGNAQDIDISDKIIIKTLKQIKEIGTLYITGGEPSLNPKAVKTIVRNLKEFNIPIANFSIYVNGYIYGNELVDALNNLYTYCYDKELCRLTVSKDYHIFDEEVIKKYMELPYFRPCGFSKIKKIKKQGRGINFKNADKSLEVPALYKTEDKSIVVGILAINVLGDIVNGIEFSYETQQKVKLGNVLKNKILKCVPIKKHIEKFKVIDENCEVSYTIYQPSYVWSPEICRLCADEIKNKKYKQKSVGCNKNIVNINSSGCPNYVYAETGKSIFETGICNKNKN